MSINNIEKQSFGQAGAVFESGTTAVEGSFCALHIVENTVFNSITWPELSGDSITGVTILAGTTIFGDITGFTLTSGAVLAYKAAR